MACAASNSVFVEYVPQMEPILERPVARQGGFGIPFNAPGHGIEFNAEALDRYTVQRGSVSRHADQSS